MAPRSTNTILFVYKSIPALVALVSILSIAAADVLIQGTLYHLKHIVQDSDYI